MMNKKKKPNFYVPNYKKKRIKRRWRKPRGIDNKKRIKRKEFGASPKVGYKNSSKNRGFHPLGIREMMIHNINELMEKARNMKEKWAVRIGCSVSKRNKESIRNKAKELGVKTLN